MPCCFAHTEFCRCCKCWNNVIAKFDMPCCNRYFPEWKVTVTWWLWVIKTVTVIIFSGLMFTFFYLWNEDVFTTARITFGSAFILAVFSTYTVFLCLLYGPYLIQTYPWWLSIVIMILWTGLGLFLLIYQLILGKGMQWNDDLEWFGIWTIVHFLAGPFFALWLPFFWMLLIITVWEIMEVYTKGFGESETLFNRSVDIGVCVVGWWMLILIFKHTRNDIPWISAMNAAGNNGKQIDWNKLVNKITCGHCFKTDEKTETQMEKQISDESLKLIDI